MNFKDIPYNTSEKRKSRKTTHHIPESQHKTKRRYISLSKSQCVSKAAKAETTKALLEVTLHARVLQGTITRKALH